MDEGSTLAPSAPVAGSKRKDSPKNTIKMMFLEMPDDALLAILSKCDIKTLGKLCQVCHKLNSLIQLESVWLTRQDGMFLVGSSCLTVQTSNYNRSRYENPGLKEQFRLSHNWSEKKYKEKVLCRLTPRQLPWLQFVDGHLWCSMNNKIRCYNVQKDGFPREEVQRRLVLKEGIRHHRKRTVSSEDHLQYPNLKNEDVSRFVVKGNIAVSGCRDGSMYIFDCDKGECKEKLHKVHRTDTQTVDIHDACILSGSRDSTVKIQRMGEADEQTEVKMSITIEDRIWSAAFSPHGQSFVVGSSGCKGSLPLSVWDTNSGQFLFSLGKLRYGAGILDMKFEDQHTLLSCGYEACLKMWDLRTQQCVAAWPEPFDSTLYCVQTDGSNAMVTGTSRYGMLRLWDKRNSAPVQEYFMSQKSPVYSAAFDTHRLYGALDSSIRILDFSVLPT